MEDAETVEIPQANEKLASEVRGVALRKTHARLIVGVPKEIAFAKLQPQVHVAVFLCRLVKSHDVSTLPALGATPHGLDLGIKLRLDSTNCEVWAIHDLNGVLRSRGALRHPQNLRERAPAEQRLFSVELKRGIPA
jgi:hypothetical protein